MRVTMLGCGNSGGVPLIGCNCAVCSSSNPKNKRTRVSSLIEVNNISILIDTSPDLYQQAIRSKIARIDAVLFTHDHADHTHGIDELRSFNFLSGKEIPVFGNREAIKALETRFTYAFKPKPENIWYRPCLKPVIISEDSVATFDVLGVPVTAFKQNHGKGSTLGFRIGNFAYSTDADALPEASLQALEGTEVWFVDCLRYTKSHSHSYLEQTLGWVSRIKPKRAFLIHMAHEFDYDKLKSELPEGIEPGYDGLVVDM